MSAAEFLDTQLRLSQEALEQAGVLQPGEFDELIHGPLLTNEQRDARKRKHTELGAKALGAVRTGWLREEHFNIWSGRRKSTDGKPIIPDFERAFQQAKNYSFTRRRGALTAIVRSFQQLEEEMLEDCILHISRARNLEELALAEAEAKQAGVIIFELYHHGPEEGRNYFVRSAGRFKRSSEVRELIDTKREEMSKKFPGVVVPEVALPELPAKAEVAPPAEVTPPVEVALPAEPAPPEPEEVPRPRRRPKRKSIVLEFFRRLLTPPGNF